MIKIRRLRGKEWFLVIFNVVYIVAFAAYYIIIHNYEFLWYVGVLVLFFVLIAATMQRSKLSYLTLWGLSIWGAITYDGGRSKVWR